jgi:hypothetical protein
VQVNVKLVVVVSGTVARVPLMGCVPLQPPEAVQDWALLAFHVKVTEWPDSTDPALDCRAMTGLKALEEVPVAEPSPPCSIESPPHAATVAAMVPSKAQRANAPVLRRATETINFSPCSAGARWLGPRTVLCRDEIVNASAEFANVSPNAYASVWRHWTAAVRMSRFFRGRLSKRMNGRSVNTEFANCDARLPKTRCPNQQRRLPNVRGDLLDMRIVRVLRREHPEFPFDESERRGSCTRTDSASC